MHSSVVRRYLSLGLLVWLTGCATARQQEALYKEVHKHVYSQPIEKVWPEVVSLVSSEGYPHRKGNQEFILLTEWRQDTQESRVVSSTSRLYVEGLRVDRNTCMVRIFRHTIFTGNKGAMNARENAFTSSMTVGAAGDANPFNQDPVHHSHMDHKAIVRGPAQMTRSVDRDGALEWKLIQRVDAQAAEAIKARLAAEEKK